MSSKRKLTTLTYTDKLKAIKAVKSGLKTRKEEFKKKCLAAFASCLFSVSDGLSIGISTVMLPQLKEDRSFPYDQYYDSWIASTVVLSMIISSLLTGIILDKLGRKLSHIIFNIPFLFGWSCMTVANNNTLIVIGRYLCGISTGATKPITLVYVGEIAEPKHRSTFLLALNLSIHVGVLLSHIVGKYFYWKTSCALCLIPAVASIITTIYLKESPLWLLSKGRIYEGVENFKWFRGEGEEAKSELESIMETQTETTEKMTLKEFKRFLLRKKFMKVITALLFLVIAIQWCGLSTISFYATDVYNKTFSGRLDGYILVLAIDCLRTFESILLCIFVNWLPRRITFMASSFGVSLSLALLCIFLYINSDIGFWVLLTLIVLYTGFGSALITIGWTFIPEILPNNCRGLGSAFATSTLCGFMFLSVKMLPYILDTYGVLTMYLIFTIATMVSTIVLWFLLPETSGKTLQAIENDFTENKAGNTKM